jgi:AcrR family transcriptional regulator
MLNTRSKNGRGDQRRNEILASATRAIRENGLRGAGMREIARAAGLSTGNLYYYFRNKQELVYFCQDQALDQLLERLNYAYRFPDPARQLEVVIEGHLRVLLSGGAALHLEVDELPKPLYRKIVQKRDKYERGLRELIIDGQKAKLVRAGDPKLQAFVLLGALNWAARWYRPSADEQNLDAIVATFQEQLMRGLLCTRV